jgi:hypothetical protein
VIPAKPHEPSRNLLRGLALTDEQREDLERRLAVEEMRERIRHRPR